MTENMPENPKAPPKGELYTILPDGRWAFWFDHHTIQNFNTCEQLFAYRSLQHLRLKGPARPVLSIGSWWSCVMEDFYNLLAVGQLPSKMAMLAIAGDHWRKMNMNEMAKYYPDKFEDFAISMKPTDVNRIVGAEVASTDSPLPVGPILMALRYYDTYAVQDFANWKIIGAERGFGLRGEVKIGENDLVVVYYIGKPDLVVYEKATNVLAPADHKTMDYVGSDFDVKWKPHPQTAGYIYAVQQIARDLGYDQIVDRCIINGAARKEPSEKPRGGGKPKPRFKRAYPHYSPAEIEEWRVGIMAKATRLRYCIEHKEFIWKESSCHIFGGCDYRRLCSKPPDTRNLVLEADFQKVDPWSPYEVEEV